MPSTLASSVWIHSVSESRVFSVLSVGFIWPLRPPRPDKKHRGCGVLRGLQAPPRLQSSGDFPGELQGCGVAFRSLFWLPTLLLVGEVEYQLAIKPNLRLFICNFYFQIIPFRQVTAELRQVMRTPSDPAVTYRTPHFSLGTKA